LLLYCFLAIVHLDEIAFRKCFVQRRLVQFQKKSGQPSKLPQVIRADVCSIFFCKTVDEERDSFVTKQDDRTKPSRFTATLPSDSLLERSRAKIGID
jgi:hypothetical protein